VLNPLLLSHCFSYSLDYVSISQLILILFVSCKMGIHSDLIYCSILCFVYADESASAAIVAVELISSARLALKLDSVRTEYSAQYLVDKAGSRNLRRRRKLTVKDCLNFALKKGGIPRAEDWPPLGSESKTPSSYEPALVSMKGEVIEPKDMDEVPELLVHQSAVGAKLHVFTPHIELQQDVSAIAVS